MAAALLLEARKVPGAAAAAVPVDSAELELERIIARSGGRAGVCSIDTGNGRSLGSHADERFAMCSTFKWLLAAAILAQSDAGQMSLTESINVKGEPLIHHSPVTSRPGPAAAFSIEALCIAAVEESDNTAANLLLRRIGGPAGLTRYLRQLGDATTRLDRNEPTLNTNLPGDPRDTTTARAMATTMKSVLLGTGLRPESRARLIGWLKDCATGRDRLRAGLPPDWVTGDKTGTGDRGAVNDLAITWPPERAPILIVVYLSGSKLPVESLSRTHAQIARLVAATFAA